MWLVATILNSVVPDNRNVAFRNANTLKENMKKKKKIRQKG